jgi:type II secretory pathway pseudopilin PulG
MTGNKKCKKNGITLIELLMGLGLFSIVIIAFLQLFTSAFKEQNKILSKLQLLDNGSYASEYMSRALRMARKDLLGTCIPVNNNYIATANGIKFLNYKDQCQEFFLDGTILKTSKSGFAQPIQSLTPSNLIAEALNFNISGEQGSDLLQPKVTFALKLKNNINGEILNIQTTVSQRDMDIKK